MTTIAQRAALLNAAGIAGHWPSADPLCPTMPGRPHLHHFDAIPLAAAMMAERQLRPGFSWDTARHDWKATCCELAWMIAHRDVATPIWPRDIENILADSMEEPD